MGAATNIPISATTTDFQSAIRAAQSITGKFEHDLAKLVTSFRATTGASAGFTNGLASQIRMVSESARVSAEAARRINEIKAPLAQVKSLLGGAFSIGALLSFGQAIGQTTGKFEKYQAVLKTGLGSRSGAKDNLNVLTEFAADTPYAMDELTGSFVKFVNRGLTPTKKELTNLGDLAASQGKGFDQLTEAVLDAQSGEFERLKEFGIKASKSGDSVTLSFRGVTKTIKNTSEEVTKAILGFGQLSGVAGGMAAVSQTLEGKLSNLGDSFDRLLVALGDGGLGAGFKEAIDMGQKFLTVITDLIAKSPVEDLRSQQTELNGLVGAIALASDNEAVRLNLIQKLKQEYPEFLGNLNSESITTDLLAQRLADVNKQYEQKIRIALGQKAIKQAADELTHSIDQQSNALKQLSLASGKSLTDLEKLGSKGRIALAKDLATNEPQQQRTAMGYIPVPSPMAAVATVLERAGKTQATAQAELNKLLGENATRQADLTTTTVAGYQQQISLIRQKIGLHKIEKAEGIAEIKRLNDQILIAQGKPLPVLATKPTNTTTRAATPVGLASDNLSIFKRYAAQVKKEIEAIGSIEPKKGDSALLKQKKEEMAALLKQKQEEFTAITNSIEQLEARSAQSQKITIPALSEIIRTGTQAKVDAIVRSFAELSDSNPFLFAKADVKDFLTDIQKAAPSLEFLRAKIEAIRSSIAALTLNNVKVPPELLKQLEDLKRLLAAATGGVNKADTATNEGGAEDKNDSKWEKRARQRIKRMKAAGNEVNVTAQELGGQMKQAAMGFAQAGLAAFEAIGTALGSGENPLKAALQSITDTLGNYLIKQGEALALAALFEQTAVIAAGPLAPLLELPVGFQLAASAALVAGGAAVKAVGKFAKGGVFTQPTLGWIGEYPGAGLGNPEIATPQNIMAQTFRKELQAYNNPNSPFNTLRNSRYGNLSAQPQVVELNINGVLRGSDIHLSQRRYLTTQNVYGGS